MAKALLASIPLGLVLVAAVIVPVALTPGTFGFHRWPQPQVSQIAEGPRHPGAASESVSGPGLLPAAKATRKAALATGPGRSVRRPAASTRSSAGRTRRTTAESPARHTPPRPGDSASGPGSAHGGEQPASGPAEQQPAAPLPPAEQPAAGADEPAAPADQVATVGEAPVLRDTPAEEPAEDLPVLDIPPPVAAPQVDDEDCEGLHLGLDLHGHRHELPHRR